jgi:hypothetical protein
VKRLRIALVLAAALPSCFDDASNLSSDLATADLSIYVAGEITSDATTLSISLSSTEASAGLIRLVEGDRLRLRSPGFEVSPTRSTDRYLAVLPPDVGDWSVHLERPSDDGASVLLPIPRLSRPTAAPSFSRAEGLEVRWTPSDDTGFPVTIQLAGPCIPTVTRTLSPDPGGYTFQAADLGASNETCDVVLVLSRLHEGLDESTPLRFAQYYFTSTESRGATSAP